MILAAAEAEALHQQFEVEYGNMFVYEAVASVPSHGQHQKQHQHQQQWYWSVGREVLSARRRGTTTDYLFGGPAPAAAALQALSSSSVSVAASIRNNNNNTNSAQQLLNKRLMRVQLYEVEGREDKLSADDRKKLLGARKQIKQSHADAHTLETQKHALCDALRGAELSVESIEASLQDDFAEIYDMLQAARRSVQSLTLPMLAEVRSFSRPPAMVKSVMSEVCMVLGSARGISRAEPSWEHVREQIRSMDFVRDVRDFEPASMSKELHADLTAKLARPDFSLERAKKSSQAVAPLYNWLLAIENCSREAQRSSAFFQLSKNIAHQRERMRNFAAELVALEPKLAAVREQVERNDAVIDRLLFGGHLEFLHVGGAGAAAGTSASQLVSSPFEGITFVPATSFAAPFFLAAGVIQTQMLRVQCHELGPVLESPENDEPPTYILSENRAEFIRNLFSLPKPRVVPFVGAGASGNVSSSLLSPASGKGGKKSASRGPRGGASGAAAAASSSRRYPEQQHQQQTPRSSSKQPTPRGQPRALPALNAVSSPPGASSLVSLPSISHRGAGASSLPSVSAGSNTVSSSPSAPASITTPKKPSAPGTVASSPAPQSIVASPSPRTNALARANNIAVAAGGVVGLAPMASGPASPPPPLAAGVMSLRGVVASPPATKNSGGASAAVVVSGRGPSPAAASSTPRANPKVALAPL